MGSIFVYLEEVPAIGRRSALTCDPSEQRQRLVKVDLSDVPPPLRVRMVIDLLLKATKSPLSEGEGKLLGLLCAMMGEDERAMIKKFLRARDADEQLLDLAFEAGQKMIRDARKESKSDALEIALVTKQDIGKLLSKSVRGETSETNVPVYINRG